MTTILLNGKIFSANSLTHDVYTGYYKVWYKSSIRLFNRAGEHIATINKEGVLCHCTHLPDGKIWYSHATVKEIGEWDSYLKGHDERKAALRAVGITPKFV